MMRFFAVIAVLLFSLAARGQGYYEVSHRYVDPLDIQIFLKQTGHYVFAFTVTGGSSFELREYEYGRETSRQTRPWKIFGAADSVRVSVGVYPRRGDDYKVAYCEAEWTNEFTEWQLKQRGESYGARMFRVDSEAGGMAANDDGFMPMVFVAPRVEDEDIVTEVDLVDDLAKRRTHCYVIGVNVK